MDIITVRIIIYKNNNTYKIQEQNVQQLRKIFIHFTCCLFDLHSTFASVPHRIFFFNFFVLYFSRRDFLAFLPIFSKHLETTTRCSLLRCKHYHWFPSGPGTHGYLLSLSSPSSHILSLSLLVSSPFPPFSPSTVDFLAPCHCRSFFPSFAFCYRTISTK